MATGAGTVSAPIVSRAKGTRWSRSRSSGMGMGMGVASHPEGGTKDTCRVLVRWRLCSSVAPG